MKTFHSVENFSSQTQTVLTIGTFDGVHIGHKKILQRLLSTAKQHNLESLVLTFFPHPRMVLQKDTEIKLIHTIDERKNILAQLGLDNLIIQPFSKEFSRLSATEFVRDVLVDKLNVKHIIVGYDHRFGRNRTANIDALKEFGDIYDFTVEEISAQDINDVAVSSTKIRKALTEGHIQTANRYLDDTFQLNGIVTKGKGIGRTIHFPTANVSVTEDYKMIPKNGVYIATATIGNETYQGMMNIGYNPTVNGTSQSIEIHLFNFDNDIYNKNITINVLKRLRDESKFDSVNALKLQLKKDKEEALTFFESHD
ncbi:MAG: bifunctional riboflavin kinase/FAD synthetase [Flavobacteriaceae bacterium]